MLTEFHRCGFIVPSPDGSTEQLFKLILKEGLAMGKVSETGELRHK